MPRPPCGLVRRRARESSDDEALARHASEDPYGAYDELHAVMTRHILRHLRDEERSGGRPSRDVTDRLREYRQLTEALATYRGSHGAEREAKEFFGTLEERIASLASLYKCANCGTSFEPDDLARPVGEPT